jgi:alpha-galactosidase
MQGISPDHFLWEIAPGESFESPEAVLAVSNCGFGGLSEKMHRFVNDHIVPKKWQNRSRPVLYND